MLVNSNTRFEAAEGKLSGSGVSASLRVVGDLAGIFLDEEARSRRDPREAVYEVVMHDACGAAEGGLFFGVSRVYPGKIGAEYFMTKGHFHSKRNRAEYYWGIAGEGLLLLMDESRQCRAERVSPGSLHFISGYTAHRLVNTGRSMLVVGACWPSDAGHDYDSIQRDGFGLRVLDVDGQPQLVPADG
ncbi:glucose-6-phosphate isomerase family protein [Cohnella cellulosilytica]|uniref:glucose-6-phosphate isomerase n=1 Tax=Cohnella cellulosilytica TaxID=986710 RepID=A0ABW2FKI6_9BACL